MSNKSQQVLTDALALPPIERAELVDKLLISFEHPENFLLDKIWAKEAESRIEAYEHGEISTIPANAVFEKLNRK